MTTHTSTGRPAMRVRARQRYDGSAVQDLFRQLGAANFMDTIMMFGAAVLLSTLPFLVLMSSFASRRVDEDISNHLGLDDRASHIVAAQFHHSTDHAVSAIVIALLLGFFGTLAVASSVQIMYERIFDHPHHSSGNMFRLTMWLGGVATWLFIEEIISVITAGHPGSTVVKVLALFLGSTALFWWSMHLLLAGRMTYRKLLAPAVATGICWVGLDIFAMLYFSSTITNDSKLYGNIGVVFGLLTWFIAIAAVIIIGAVAGAVWQRRRASRP